MNLDLSGKHALVCGSTQGIGRAAAIELANLGATVTLMARNEEKLKDVLSTLKESMNREHYYSVVDFEDRDKLKQEVEAVVGRSPVHILVNNTGGPPGGAIADASIEAFEQAFSNHLLCNHILVQAVKEGMRADSYGRIINVISTSVKIPLKGLGVSNTVRGAVANWSKTMANELAPLGITVNNVLPGATATARLKGIIDNKAQKTNQSTEDIERSMKAAIPMGRIGQADEIANAIAFLASPAASYISGVNLPVDGGRTGSL